MAPITLFTAITMLCQTNNVMHNISHIQSECEEFSMEYCQSDRIFLTIRLNVRNILQIIVNLEEHCYGFE